MSSELFEAQLIGPDNAASQQQLVELITAGKFTGSGLPQVAHGYLDAFCNVSNSNGRRRRAGIALAAMMRASTGAVQRLKGLPQGLSRVGNIVLDPKEIEERRIIAGLIIRQGLEVGIAFADFWNSDKVLLSAPNFPQDSSDMWMSQFQTYLDTLTSLHLVSLDNDPLVLFPIALSAKDGFQWTGRSAVVLLEKDVLTFVASDASLTNFNFIDLPTHRIKDTSLQQNSPHDSHQGRSEHEMHEVIINLRPNSRSYCLNSSDCTVDKLKVSFLKHDDAHEFVIGLQDARKSPARSGASTAEAAAVAKSGSPPKRTYRASARRSGAATPPRHEGAASEDSDTGSGTTLDDPSSEHIADEQTPALPSKQKLRDGKLPRISLSTKQKVARTRQLPSAPGKVTKPRASKHTAPVAEESGDEDEDASSQDEYTLQPAATTSKSAAPATGKKSRGQRKAYADDEDFDPKASKGKSSTKRKRVITEQDENIQSAKKHIPTKLKDSRRSGAANTTTKKSKVKVQQTVHTTSQSTRSPIKQYGAQKETRNEEIARPSLIGALKNSNSSVGAKAPTFKRPGQPASTPGRPRLQPGYTTPKPPTPADDLPVHGPSSTPRSESIHDEDFGFGHTPTNTEILSSNTKRVPDSPHAESTAISGHADRDEVHREKCIGDLETAKSDPFKQRRHGAQKVNSFTRKLTGESDADTTWGPISGEPQSMPAELADGDFDIDDVAITFASQPLPKHSPSLLKGRTNINCHSAQVSTAYTRAIDSLPVKQPRKVSKPDDIRGPQLGMQGEEKSRQKGQQAQADKSIISASREAVEDTLPDGSVLPVDLAGFDAETTLVNEEVELPQQIGTKASDLRFRSSPPVPDSSSVRLSDESEQEPDLSPPTSRADELEWEAALQPHQRNFQEQLLRISKRVARHIVDNETAVTDITDVFAADGEHLLDRLVDRQGAESAEAFDELESKKQNLLGEFSNVSKNLKAQRKRIRAIE